MSKPSDRATDGTTDITATPGWKSGIGAAPGTGVGNGGEPVGCRRPASSVLATIAQVPVTLPIPERTPPLNRK